MDKEIALRIIEIRKELNMTQSEFADYVGIGRSTLGMMEVDKREILERHIKLISTVCNVNEHWLRTGEGSMLDDTAGEIIAELSRQRNLSDFDKRLITEYVRLSPEMRRGLEEFLVKLMSGDTEFSSELSIDEKVENYRMELEVQQKGEILSALPITKDA